MAKRKSTKPQLPSLLIDGAREVLAQYRKNHRELVYPGMAKLAAGLEEADRLIRVSEGTDESVDSNVTSAIGVPLDPT